MSWKTKQKVMDWLGKKGVFSTPSVVQKAGEYVAPNRRQRRAQLAIRSAALATPARRKHEKRGAPGRASKGRSRGR